MIFIDQTQSLMLKHFLVEPAPYQNCRRVNNQILHFKLFSFSLQGRERHSISALGGRLVICGGNRGLSSCISWQQPETSWTHFANMRLCTYLIASCVSIWILFQPGSKRPHSTGGGGRHRTNWRSFLLLQKTFLQACGLPIGKWRNVEK